jgi:adenine-specific DNA-methyltransferase
MGARYPYYLLADSPEGQRKEGGVSHTPPKETPTRGDIRQGFVYDRVPHITLKSIANNAEIDVIWEKWQETLEPLRARLNAELGRDPHPPIAKAMGPSLSRGAGEGLAMASDKPLSRTAGEGGERSEAGEGDAAAPWEEWEIPREAGSDWPTEAQKLHTEWWAGRIARQKERRLDRRQGRVRIPLRQALPRQIRASASLARSRSRACRRTALFPVTPTTP